MTKLAVLDNLLGVAERVNIGKEAVFLKVIGVSPLGARASTQN